jgi:hypothetical protein
MPYIFIPDEFDTTDKIIFVDEDMSAPFECMICHKIHDAGKVEVLQRYMDCSMWKCPHCNATINDRPIGWGGSARPVDKMSTNRMVLTRQHRI